MAKIYQVFIGCPFKQNIRENYERLRREFQKDTPLAFVLADTGTMTSGDYLLDRIHELIADSAACIFDVTDGNPNVSLEVGIAHALPSQYVLALSTRKPRKTKIQREAERESKKEGEVKPIISDLQGMTRIEYKRFPELKTQILERFLPNVPFYKRWADFKMSNKSLVKHALLVLAQARDRGRTLGPRIDATLEGTGVNRVDLVNALVRAKLLRAKRGQQGGYFLVEK